jgi:hypothetical protein
MNAYSAIKHAVTVVSPSYVATGLRWPPGHATVPNGIYQPRPVDFGSLNGTIL